MVLTMEFIEFLPNIAPRRLSRSSASKPSTRNRSGEINMFTASTNLLGSLVCNFILNTMTIMECVSLSPWSAYHMRVWKLLRLCPYPAWHYYMGGSFWWSRSVAGCQDVDTRPISVGIKIIYNPTVKYQTSKINHIWANDININIGK